jgi:hypothetical protein
MGTSFFAVVLWAVLVTNDLMADASLFGGCRAVALQIV